MAISPIRKKYTRSNDYQSIFAETVRKNGPLNEADFRIHPSGDSMAHNRHWFTENGRHSMCTQFAVPRSTIKKIKNLVDPVLTG
jgi:hypothetical protein